MNEDLVGYARGTTFLLGDIKLRIEALRDALFDPVTSTLERMEGYLKSGMSSNNAPVNLTFTGITSANDITDMVVAQLKLRRVIP